MSRARRARHVASSLVFASGGKIEAGGSVEANEMGGNRDQDRDREREREREREWWRLDGRWYVGRLFRTKMVPEQIMGGW